MIGASLEPREPEELDSISDCVEEVLIEMQRAQVLGQVASAIERSQIGSRLYDRIEAIMLRAQALRPEEDPGSSLRSESPVPLP